MGMDRMFRVMGFFLLMAGLMFFVGGMNGLGILFVAQAAGFFVISYARLTERGYMYVLGLYMVVAFVGMVFWSFFVGVPTE